MSDMSINRRIAELRGEIKIVDLFSKRMGIKPDADMETFPDYEHDLNAAWPLFWELPEAYLGFIHDDDGREVEYIEWRASNSRFAEYQVADHTPQALATAICEVWLRVHETVNRSNP